VAAGCEGEPTPLLGLDTTEAAALAPGTGWTREGPTRLRFRPARGAALVFVDDTADAGTYRRHRALGRLPGTAYAVVHRGYYEADDHLLVFTPTGDTLALTDAPLLSPDRRYVAAATADLSAGYEDNALELVALTARGPRREFVRVTSATTDTGGWAPVGLHWRGDTLTFDRVDAAGAQPGACRATPARLVRRAGAWIVEDAAR
jgi:hypothetical protein